MSETPEAPKPSGLVDIHGRAIGVPSAQQQLDAKEKKAVQDVMDVKETEGEAIDSVARLFHNLSRIEKRIPALIDFAFKLSHAVAQWADEQHADTKRVTLGEIFWDPFGNIAFDLIYDPMDVSPKEKPEYLKSGWGRMPKLAEQFPCLVEFVMTVGMHFTAMANRRELSPRGLVFSNLHHFTNRISKRPAFAFHVVDNSRRRVKPGQVNL